MNLIFTCGGTAGHINPAIAVANMMKQRYPFIDLIYGTHNMYCLPEYIYRVLTERNPVVEVMDIDGEILVVSNFTLNANYSHGNRPDYFASAAPGDADALYEYFKGLMSTKTKKLACGVFGADMRTEMSTDGPVTIVMDSGVLKGGRK